MPITRSERRLRRRTHIAKRMKIYEENPAGGTLYERHVQKIEDNGGGYMAKHGTLKHYAQGNNISRKSRDKKTHDGAENWSYRDQKQIEDEREQLSELEEENDDK